ncbi:T9SS type B sorting domain-containing protein [uncultured Lacinutrix sp.]|uniref:T9SS type B sorting domain-containing protein n=1 Tax=uncultured Lacinutrix sp. TaxID=574032 RepID=UPI00262E625F|nr:choice-of-anchor L domain-containing protein [uncultured Lacinutrix sp.]
MKVKTLNNYVNHLAYLIVFTCALQLNAQQITVDNTQTPEQLINSLVEGCVDVTNISSPVNGDVNGFSSYGSFQRANSNFPFENGIVLSTGNVNSAGNVVNTNALNEGDTAWQTDPDLENALGINNTLNATSIEFNFTSASSTVQFNYILASEEYFADYPCNYSDGFAFLIKEANTTQPYQNIAVIPGTTTPVNTSTIHQEIVGFCDAENETHFEGYNIGDTNFNGRTTVMSASATITPNVEYNIKLIIADQTDRNFDSAVFIEGNSFTDNVTLGPDFSTCDASSVLNADTNNPQATYEWFLNGSLIGGEVSSTLTANTSGTYQVIVTVPLNTTTCTFEDEINVTLNSIQTTTPLSDFTLCDDASNDGVENFDLTTLNTSVENNLPASNYTISYHISNQDAIDNVNSFLALNNFQNPQTVFIRAIDTNSGCVYISNVNLIVNPFPTITQPNPIDICSNGSGEATLTDIDSEITNNNANYSVTYHFSQVDANTGANAIPSPYTPTNTTEQLFIRVIDVTTGCVAFTDITIQQLDSPNVNTDVQQINACEQDDDGFEIFDITSVANDVLQGATNVTVTYHLTIEDANNNVNPITNPTAFQNTEAELQIVYIRISNNNNSCYEIVPIELHANLLQTGTNIQNFGTCDTAPNDGSADFDLQSITTFIANGLPNITITYYESQEDLDNNVNPIDDSVPYTVNNSFHTLYIFIEDSTCTNTAEIGFIVNPAISIQNPGLLNYCDTNDDTFTSVDLDSFNTIISVGIASPIVEYYETLVDAELQQNQLPPFYDNTSNPFTVFVRVSGNGNGCSDIIPVQIEVLPAPTVNTPSNFVICDDDQDGFSIIDLTTKNVEINTDATTIISYYLSEDDANNSVNEITNNTNYNAQTATVYAKVENNTTSCYALVPIDITVNTLPDFPNISNFRNCETDGNQIADFILADKDVEILNGQTGKEVFYFENETDAINKTNIIDKNAVYNNTSQIQTLYVRVENITDTTCYGISNFIIEVGSVPIFNAPLDVNVCDDNSNDGIDTFSLSDKAAEISANSTDNLTITFYNTLEDAENEVNAIQGDTFTNTTNPQQLFVNIDNGTYCKGIATYEYNIIQVPEISSASDLTQCDTDTDGSVTFDLTIVEVEVLAIRQDNIIVNYYANEADLIAGTNQIPNPTNYNNTSNPQTVYIEAYNTISNCGANVSFDLIVNLPPEIANIAVYDTCDNEDDSFNLSETTEALIGTQENVVLTFYSSLIDAENSQNALDTNYNYVTTSDTIFVRAEFSTTNCFQISSFNLVVNNIPNLTPQNLEACDDDFDNFLMFDLSQQTPIILGTQNPNDFTVNYFETENDANNNTNAISDLNYNAENEQIIYVYVENNTTGCFSTTSFSTLVRRKPEVDITDQVICLDNLPLTVSAETGVNTDSYSWSTGETSSVIEIDQVGNYSVTVTSNYGCTTTSNFSVTESEAAVIEFTETIDFGNPNNLTITVSGIGEYLYQFDNGAPQESNFFANVPIGPHTITVIDLNGCNSTTKEIVIIDAPQYFTPNGDTINETWHITGVELLEGTVVSIFDRYGKLLSVITHSSRGWDGNYNGNPMPATDYWFLADVKKGAIEFQVKGHFALRR